MRRKIYKKSKNFHKIVSKYPFGYKTVLDCYNLYVRPKFEVLKTSLRISEYYDFINALGLLLNWIDIEKDKNHNITIPNEDDIDLFKALYNNIKHFQLEKRKYDFYVQSEYNYFLKNENGITYLNENMFWNDEGVFTDDCSDLGESGDLSVVLLIKNLNNNKNYNTDNKIFLYELCKRAFENTSKVLGISIK